MNESKEILAPEVPLRFKRIRKDSFRLLPKRLLVAIGLLAACFSLSLYRLVRFALESDLYSYILLVPFVSAYLFGVKSRISPEVPSADRGAGLALVVAGGAVLGGFGIAVLSGVRLVPQDSLALTTLSFVLLLAGVSALVLDKSVFRGAAIAFGFLLFMVPFPVPMEHAIESFLQHGSAPPASWFFKLAGTPVFQQDLVFQLPGMTLQIAPECSGIRSTLVLFMTSLIAGHLFLRSPWKRTVIAVAVVPLALLRNGLRVFTIGELCVHIGPHMIDSDIHHKGGPIFFALSLIPFFFLLFFLVRQERPVNRAPVVLAAR